MRNILFIVLLLLSCANSLVSASDKGQSIMQLSIDFLGALQDGIPTESYAQGYAELDLDTLARSMNTEDEKLAFWINTYNAFVQHILLSDTTLFDDRGKFFGTKRVNIAGEMFSFDDIEHGIIRSSRWKLSLGYIRNPFAARPIKMLRTKSPDGRVHFALNCGAISCPKIATYYPDKVEGQLDIIAEQYLKSTSVIDNRTITVTPLMSWFRGDFGGKKGMKKDYLLRYGVVDEIEGREIKFGDYDWSLSLGNYTNIDLKD